MGTPHSKGEQQGQILSGGKEGVGAGQPPPAAPYAGPPVEYHYIVTSANQQFNTGFSYLHPGETLNCTDIQAYLPHLANMYTQGFRMLTFKIMPETIRAHGLDKIGTMESNLTFQGIFRRDVAEAGKWTLQVEKSVLQAQVFLGTGLCIRRDVETTTNASHVFQTIERMSRAGARLVCIEITGWGPHDNPWGGSLLAPQQERRQMQRMAWNRSSPQVTVGVDVFFEIPTSPPLDFYTYQICPVPITAIHRAGFGTFGSWEIQVNWEGVLGQYLGQGYRLAEVFIDHSAQSMMGSQMARANVTLTVNSIWIFEKPASMLNDFTPQYEATRLEFPVVMHSQVHGLGFAGRSLTVDSKWEPTIDKMGRDGWELVRILQAPGTHFQGMMQPDVILTMWMFFQRRIIRGPPLQQYGQPMPDYHRHEKEPQDTNPSYGQATQM